MDRNADHAALREIGLIDDYRDRLAMRQAMFPIDYVLDAVGRPFVRVMWRAV